MDEYSGTTISPLEEARIREEVRIVMKQQFAEAHAKLESNPVVHGNISKSGNTAAGSDVIDLISQSVASLQKSQPTILPGSPILVASTPSHVGNGGSALGFSHLSSGSHPSPPPPPFATMHWKPKEPPCFSDAVPRMSIPGHPWCLTTSPLWGAVTPSKSPTQ